MRLTVVALASSYYKKYVQREIAKASGFSIYNPIQGWRHRRKRQWIYTEDPPWTDKAKENNEYNKSLKEFIEPISESQWSIFRGDRVQILKGIDKGKIGLVCFVVKERNWCFVEGLNCEYRWINRSRSDPGVMSKVERPLLVTTEVTLVDPSDQQPTEIEWRYDEDGNRVRVSVRSGRVLPIALDHTDRHEDGTLKSVYQEQPWDTKEKELLEVTFKPSLKSFEADIMESMGIKEERKKAPTFWY